VTGVGVAVVVAEAATNSCPILAAALPLPVLRMLFAEDSDGFPRHLARHRRQELPVSFVGMAQGLTHQQQESSRLHSRPAI